MRRSEKGFTLIELLVTVAIIGILSAIAVSAYTTYRKRAYEATAITYMRNWIPAQELYLSKYGHYADADEQLEQNMHVLFVPKNVPYDFSIDSGTSAKIRWWGRANPTESGLSYLYIDSDGLLLSSTKGPPRAP